MSFDKILYSPKKCPGSSWALGTLGSVAADCLFRVNIEHDQLWAGPFKHSHAGYNF